MPMGPHSMPMGPNFPQFLRIFPLTVLAIFLVLILLFVIKRFLQSYNRQASSDGSRSRKVTFARQSKTVEVPEELRGKAREMMEGIDWDIRLLEGQLEAEKDKEERKKIQREIEEKRQQYRSIVDRFGW